MALFKINTGCRDKEVCRLRWDMEVSVPELNLSVFIVPGNQVKNNEDRLVVLNKVALSVIDGNVVNMMNMFFHIKVIQLQR